MKVKTLEKHMEEQLDLMWGRIDDRFISQEKATAQALVSAEKAVLKAESLATTRAEQQNEWRGTIGDLINTMMPRAEYCIAHSSLVEKIDNLDSRVTSSESSRRGGSSVMAWVISGIMTLIGLSGLLFGILEFMTR
jgi:hypothetical protein